MNKKTALFFLLFLTGCVTLGREFGYEMVRELKNGVTTADEVRRMFGEPYRRGVEDGDLTWTYLDYKVKLFGGRSTRDLYIKFDPAGRVKSFNYNTTFTNEDIPVGSGGATGTSL